MRILSGVPVIVQMDGLREQYDKPLDTETLLYFEQQLDRGDAVIEPLEMGESSSPFHTHRLISETGGWFHVQVDEGGGPREWPQLATPASLSALEEMVLELGRMREQMSRLLLANQLLEEEVRRLKRG